jgi:hypothetical protein
MASLAFILGVPPHDRRHVPDCRVHGLTHVVADVLDLDLIGDRHVTRLQSANVGVLKRQNSVTVRLDDQD